MDLNYMAGGRRGGGGRKRGGGEGLCQIKSAGPLSGVSVCPSGWVWKMRILTKVLGGAEAVWGLCHCMVSILIALRMFPEPINTEIRTASKLLVTELSLGIMRL